MPRIAGINIPEQKQILIALTYIYGIGRPLSGKILTQVKIKPETRASALTAAEVGKLKDLIEKKL